MVATCGCPGRSARGRVAGLIGRSFVAERYARPLATCHYRITIRVDGLQTTEMKCVGAKSPSVRVVKSLAIKPR